MQLSHPVIGESSVLLGHTAPFSVQLLNVLEKFETTLPSLKSLSLFHLIFSPIPLPWAAKHHLGKVPKEKSHGGGGCGGEGRGEGVFGCH